jgi:hypothetical protein
MSYYENRIKALEERVAQLAREQRMKAIPVEAKLVQRIAELQGENKRLTKAGDLLAFHYTALGRKVYGDDPLPSSITEWLEARKAQ